jgi:hypothetical protein
MTQILAIPEFVLKNFIQTLFFGPKWYKIPKFFQFKFPLLVALISSSLQQQKIQGLTNFGDSCAGP